MSKLSQYSSKTVKRELLIVELVEFFGVKKVQAAIEKSKQYGKQGYAGDLRIYALNLLTAQTKDLAGRRIVNQIREVL